MITQQIRERFLHNSHKLFYLYLAFIRFYSFCKKEEQMIKQEEAQNQINQRMKINKIRYFLSQNINQPPSLKSSISIFQLLRQYLNDDDFTISLDGEMIFQNDSYEPRMQLFYKQWSEEKQQQNINEFIEYWINKQPQISVKYSLFDDIEKGNKQISSTLDTPSFYQPPQKQTSIIKAIEISKVSNFKQSLDAQTPNMPAQYLRQFYNFYCKQATNKINNVTFDKYEQYYNQMNLTKWMHYLKDVGYFKFASKIKQKQFKEIFIKKQNTNKCISFQGFSQLIHHILELLFHDQNLVKQKGYELIGIKDHQSFQNKFRQMGILAPIITIKYPKSKKKESYRSVLGLSNLSSKMSSQTSLNISIQKMVDPVNLNQKKKGQSDDRNVNLKLQITQKSQLDSNIFPSKLNINRSKAKYNLKDVIREEEEDIYLQRYMHKENIEHYHYISHRIDERINKIVNKY